MEIFRALAALSEPPGPEHERLAGALGLEGTPSEAAWSDLFLFQLYPYASVYLGGEGAIGGEVRDRIAGFWRALGLVPPAECDHLAVLLAFYAEVCDREETAVDPTDAQRWHHVRSALLEEHLLSWLPPYLVKLDHLEPGFYRSWGALLGQALAAEAEAIGRPPAEPLHWRQAPRPEDPRRSGGKAFLQSLLTPAASGLFLVRSDLERAAAELGLGLRLAERRFLLESLLGQDADGTLEWLAREATSWSDLLSRAAEGRRRLAFWAERAAASAALITSLRET